MYIALSVVPGCVVGMEILWIRYESWQIEALFKGCSLSAVYVGTMMEFKSTSISAVHLSLSCAFLTVAVLTEVLKKIYKEIYKTSSVYEVNTGSEGETLKGKEEKV